MSQKSNPSSFLCTCLIAYTLIRSGGQTTILVITDGEPNNKRSGTTDLTVSGLLIFCEVKQTIINASNRLQRDEDLSISFVQVGRDRDATRFLKELDDDLRCKFDIVDTLPAGNTPFCSVRCADSILDALKNMSFEQFIQLSIND